MSAEIDVIIVGGGAAGIGAARRLAKAERSALVLEAASRVGGRAWTEEIAGFPLDYGCGWLHSADRNSWVSIAELTGFAIDRSHPAWGNQYQDLGFTSAEQVAARQAFAAWIESLATNPPPSDCAADALTPHGEWNSYVQAMSGFISGDVLRCLSVADYMAYHMASTGLNWRVPSGYGTLVAASFPTTVALHVATPAEAIDIKDRGVTVTTPAGSVRARAVILTVSTAVLARGAIKLPVALDIWRDAATKLPLGYNEKLFLEIVDTSPFESETYVIGNPREMGTGAYYIRPFGRPIIECFLGGNSARVVQESGPAAAFAFALEQLVALFGSSVCRKLRPLVASNWSNTTRVGGAYSYALPGHAAARNVLAQSFEQCLFFAGEATHPFDFSTAHGAYETGVRAAEEAIAALTRSPV